MDGYLTIGTDIDTSKFDAQIDYIEQQMEEIEHKLAQADMGMEVGDTGKLEAKYEKLSLTLDKLKKKRREALGGFNLGNIKNQLSQIDGSIKNTIKTMSRWALAIFSIRSAYAGVRKAISLVSQYNKQVGTDLEYMQYAIAMGISSAVEKLISILYKMLIYVNELLKAWFNIDLFANASAGNFKKAQKNAEKMKKSLAGFDTANVLQDSSANSNTETPSVDLSKVNLEGQKPEWLQDIINFGQWVIDNWLEVIGLLSLSKLVIDLLTGNWVGAIIDFIVFIISQMPRLVKAIGVVWDGIVAFFKWILEGLQSLSDTATKFIGDCIAWIWDKITWIFTHFEDILGVIGNAIGVAIQFIINLIVGAVDGIASILGTVGGWIYEHIIKPVGDFFVGLWNGFLNGAKGAWNGIKSVFSTVGSFFKTTFENAWNGVKKIFSTGGKIFNGIKEGIVNSFKAIVNALIKGVNVIVSTPFNAINSMLNKIRNTSFLGVSPFKGLWSENPIAVPKINYLAHGGIVNVPKVGVPLASNVVAGEEGPEAVLPLNDANMERIAKYIARYININIDLTNKLDSRVLSRVLQQIKAEQNFARNGV